jgi:hypothetical protein
VGRFKHKLSKGEAVTKKEKDAKDAGNRINLELPEPVYKKLKAQSERVGISVGDVARIAVSEYLERIESRGA